MVWFRDYNHWIIRSRSHGILWFSAGGFRADLDLQESATIGAAGREAVAASQRIRAHQREARENCLGALDSATGSFAGSPSAETAFRTRSNAGFRVASDRDAETRGGGSVRTVFGAGAGNR